MARIFQTLTGRSIRRARKQTITLARTFKRNRKQFISYLPSQSQNKTRPTSGHIYP